MDNMETDTPSSRLRDVSLFTSPLLNRLVLTIEVEALWAIELLFAS